MKAFEKVLHKTLFATKKKKNFGIWYWGRCRTVDYELLEGGQQNIMVNRDKLSVRDTPRISISTAH